MLSFLKPVLLPVVKFIVGKIITKDVARHIIDIVFADAHAVSDNLPTKGVVLAAIERNVDKDALADEIVAFLNAAV